MHLWETVPIVYTYQEMARQKVATQKCWCLTFQIESKISVNISDWHLSNVGLRRTCFHFLLWCFGALTLKARVSQRVSQGLTRNVHLVKKVRSLIRWELRSIFRQKYPKITSGCSSQHCSAINESCVFNIPYPQYLVLSQGVDQRRVAFGGFWAAALGFRALRISSAKTAGLLLECWDNTTSCTARPFAATLQRELCHFESGNTVPILF